MTNNPFKERRFGQIEIASEIAEDIEAMRALLAHFVPLRVEYRFESQLYIYSGYSPNFLPSDQGKVIPTYSAILKDTNGGPAMLVDFQLKP